MCLIFVPLTNSFQGEIIINFLKFLFKWLDYHASKVFYTFVQNLKCTCLWIYFLMYKIRNSESTRHFCILRIKHYEEEILMWTKTHLHLNIGCFFVIVANFESRRLKKQGYVYRPCRFAMRLKTLVPISL